MGIYINQNEGNCPYASWPMRQPNWSESMFATMRPPVANMSQELFWSISNLVQWTPSDLDPMDKFSDLTTLSLDNLELETIGQKDTTQKALSLSTLFWTWYAKNQNHVTACKASS